MAHEDVIDILKSKIQNPNVTAQRAPLPKSKLTGVVHCFTGDLNEAKQYMELGFYLGINGIIFKLDLDKIIKQIPLDKILVETDCPYLIPPEAGVERNEPKFVKIVAKRIAELKNVSFEKVGQATTANAMRLFKFDQSR